MLFFFHLLPGPPPSEYAQSSSSTSVQPTYVNMTELATMAANKITNNVTQQQAQPLHSPVLSSTSASSLVSPDSSATNPISSISSPVEGSLAYSLQTPQNVTPLNSTPQTPLAATAPSFSYMSGGGILCSTPSSTAGDGDSNCSTQINASSAVAAANNGATTAAPSDTAAGGTTNKTSKSSSCEVAADDPQSIIPDNYCKSAGSVLEKANIFENLEKQQAKQASQIPRAESIYGRREEIYKSAPSSERDSGKSRTHLHCFPITSLSTRP